MASNNQDINPRPCIYICSIQIYWNTSVNEYWEVFTTKKHICPNRTRNTTTNTTTRGTAEGGITPPSNSPRPRYYNPSAKKQTPYASFSAASKPKMSYSFELLTAPTVAEIQKKYEILSDIVSEYNGKVNGSQRDRDPKTGVIDLLVYYEVPLGQRKEVKRKFNDFVLSIITRTN
jgi:hypothetical protein